MPAAIPIAMVVASGVSSYAASRASQRAAEAQSNAANHGADLQAQGNRDALAFQQRAAEADYRNQELARRANYDQYLTRLRGAQNLGGAFGFQLPSAAPYVPSIDPHYDPTDVGPQQQQPAVPSSGAYAGLNPQDAWQKAVGDLGLQGWNAQGKDTLQRVADYLGQQGYQGFKATGDDTIDAPGLGSVDVRTAGNQWWWGPEGAKAFEVGNGPQPNTIGALFSNPQSPFATTPNGGGYLAMQPMQGAPTFAPVLQRRNLAAYYGVR